MTDEWEISDGELWHHHEVPSACMALVVKSESFRGPQCSYCGKTPPENIKDVALLAFVKYTGITDAR